MKALAYPSRPDGHVPPGPGPVTGGGASKVRRKGEIKGIRYTLCQGLLFCVLFFRTNADLFGIIAHTSLSWVAISCSPESCWALLLGSVLGREGFLICSL